MSDNFDEKDIWDDALGQCLVGKVLLVGITYVGVDGSVIAQQQFFGEAVSVHPRKGILLSLRGQRLGEQYNLPPDTRAV
jgi:hypothetical protein